MKEIKKVVITNDYFEDEIIVGVTENEGRKVDKIKVKDYSGRKIAVELFDKESNQLATLLIPGDAVMEIIFQ